MSIFTDLKSVRSGMKKAKRDYAKVLAFDAEHAARHEADPSYLCGAFTHDFWENLANDVHPNINIFEAAGYAHVKNRLQKKHGTETVDISMIPVEMDGDETPIELFQKIMRTMADKAVFDEQVSETTPPVAKSGPKHKKGGK